MLRPVKIDVLKYHQSQISLLVFDECHCISEWGLDFRPDYRKVSDIVSLFSDIQTLLLSTTATMSVQNDLYNLLALDEENTRVVAKLPDRPNVFIHVEQQPLAFGLGIDIPNINIVVSWGVVTVILILIHIQGVCHYALTKK
ncbi:uncharacterized protein LOC127736560 [Mytilus californianus]|uniref:uncharacterized protein LOC127736560 n=1 Tax=Mytilus californianus TaxID=6549 RepID=UPI0022469F6F|nr:uncharacterized protein LOC127736560 [Mytilus californianus]